MESNSIKNKVIKGFAWQGASKLLIQLFSWTTTIWVARILAPEDYGIVAIQGIFTVTIGTIVDMGVSRGLIQKKTINDKEIDSIFYFSLLFGLLIYAAYFTVAPYIAQFYELPELTLILRIGGLSFILASLKSVPLAITMRNMDFRYRSLVEMGGSFIQMASLLVMAIQGMGYWALILAPISGYIVTALAYYPILGRIPRPRLVIKEITGIISFGVKIMLTRLMFSTYMKADIFFLGKLAGQRSTGFYSMATQLATIPLDKIGTIFNEVAFPAISRARNNSEQVKTLFLNMHKYLLTISMPLLVGMALVAPDFVLLVLGSKWQPIIIPLQVFSLINLVRLSGMIMIPTLQAIGRPNKVLRYSVWCTLLLSAAFSWGASWGIMGVVTAWVLAYPLVYLYLVKETLSALQSGWMEFFSSIRTPLVSTILMGAAIAPLYLPQTQTLDGWPRMFAAIAFGGVTYFGSYWLFFRDEISNVIGGLRELRKK
ncbi:MAG: lipopolysaccharide biosynthesis protein [Gammaproteobacteria bacterium]|nr:lipopolysaccharide biosynthesis protein [Gammaproteobacteria bacterium]